MRDEEKTKEQLILELDALRRQIAATEPSRRLDSVQQSGQRRAEEYQYPAPPQEPEVDYRFVIESASEPICITQDGLIKFINSAGAKLTGYPLEELVSKPFAELTHPDDLEELVRIYMQRIRGEYVVPGHIFRIMTSAGEVMWVESFSSSISWEGRPAVLSMIRDVSKHVRVQERLRLAWEMSPNALSINRLRDGIFVEVNNGYTLLTGYSREEVLGKPALDIPLWANPVDREIFESELAQCGHIRNFETKFHRKDGQKRTVLISAGLMMLSGEAHVLAIANDVEDVKRAEAALRESEQKYRLLAENGSDVIWTMGLDLKLSYVSPSVERMHGWTTDEWLSFKPSDYLTPASLDLVMKVLEEEFAAQEDPDADPMRVRTLELEQYRKDGTTFWTEVSARFLYDDAGSIIGIIGATRDVDKRKRFEDELTRLFTAVEQAGETILVTDLNGTILYANPAFTIATGYAVDEAVGKAPTILKSGKQDKLFYEEMWATIKRGEVWRGRLTNKKKDGTLYEATATISPVKDTDGRVVNYVMVSRDVTTEIALQRQLRQAQKMEAVGTLAGGIAHDFNNLLQAVVGSTDFLLMRKGPDDPDRKVLEVIRQVVRDGADLVSRLLTFSRKGEFSARPIDLNNEIRRVEKLLRRTLSKMIDIDLVLAGDLHIIDADPAQIEQVILNLGVNAQHAMPEGGKLLIETSNVSLSDYWLQTQLGFRPGKYVLLTVTDTGTGMESDLVERIFEPFFTTKANTQGTGLGLAIVHGIVSQHGGYIKCYSEPGMGTCFKIYFPVSSTEPLTEVAGTREMPAFGTETVLLVDDDAHVRETARQMIEMGGYKVLTARSGEEALEIYAANANEISLVILDLIMPGMGGKQCLAEILRIDPDARALVVSGYSSNGLAQDQKKGGARGFIKKPYDAKDILAAIRIILDRGTL